MFESDVHSVLKEFETFYCDKNLLKACDSTVKALFLLDLWFLKTNSCLAMVSVSIVFVVGSNVFIKICHNINVK